MGCPPPHRGLGRHRHQQRLFRQSKTYEGLGVLRDPGTAPDAGGGIPGFGPGGCDAAAGGGIVAPDGAPMVEIVRDESDKKEDDDQGEHHVPLALFDATHRHSRHQLPSSYRCTKCFLGHGCPRSCTAIVLSGGKVSAGIEEEEHLVRGLVTTGRTKRARQMLLRLKIYRNTLCH